MDYCMKTGIRYYGIKLGNLTVGGIFALNSLGDIFDWKTGQKIADFWMKIKKIFIFMMKNFLKLLQK